MKGLVPVSALCAIGAAVAVGLTEDERLPQVASGGDVLSVAFGGAKNAISESMFRKADSYFHGGVDMDCSLEHHHHHDHDHLGHGDEHVDEPHGHGEAEHDEAHAGHEHHDAGHHDHAHHEHEHADNAGLDPWAWINVHIRAPEIERHLEGEKAVELMPWFWASVKANPKNIEAWTTAVYMADRVIKNKKLAEQILADAKKANPVSADIELAEGRYLYRGGKGDLAAAERAFAQARRLVLQPAGDGGPAALSPHDKDVLLNIFDYLSFFAERHGDVDALKAYRGEAAATGEDSFVVKNIDSRISALESKRDIR